MTAIAANSPQFFTNQFCFATADFERLGPAARSAIDMAFAPKALFFSSKKIAPNRRVRLEQDQFGGSIRN
jgi:hypothetical protein